jgi:probable phosphoglycerate mutase
MLPTTAVLDLWLIRHGQTEWNSQGRIQGQSESDLNEIGWQEAQALGERLAGIPFAGIISSDLRRTRQTTELVFPGRPALFEPRLREGAGGVLEGKTQAEMTVEQRQLIQLIDQRHLRLRPPGGESYLDIVARLEGWLAALPSSGRFACVTHEAVIYSLLAHLMGVVDGREVGPQLQILNTSITQVTFADGLPTIVRMNDAGHRVGIGTPVVAA